MCQLSNSINLSLEAGLDCLVSNHRVLLAEATEQFKLTASKLRSYSDLGMLAIVLQWSQWNHHCGKIAVGDLPQGAKYAAPS